MRKALLAGGAVLGIGASATIAAWSDDTWASMVFGSAKVSSGGILTIQSAITPDSFDSPDAGKATESDVSNARVLQRTAALDTTEFSATVTLVPGQTTYLPVYLRTSEDTESDAIVTVSQARNGATATDGVDPADPDFTADAQTPSAIWGSPDSPGYVTYGARLHQLENPEQPPACAPEFFDPHTSDSTRLFGADPVIAPVPAAEPALAPAEGEPAAAPAPETPLDALVPMDTAAPTTQFALAGAAGNTYMICFRFHLDPAVVSESPESNGAPFRPSWTFTGEATDQ